MALNRAALMGFAGFLGLLPAPARADDVARIGDKSVHISLEMVEDAVHPGQDLRVKLTFRGEGEGTATIDAGAFLAERFTVRNAKGTPQKPNSGADPMEGLTVVAFDTMERVINLSRSYSRLTKRPGAWEVLWTYGDLRAGPLRIRVTEPYDPGKDLRAVVETDLGTMTWTLMPAQAPEHVKHFVDLVRQGFYDGLTIFKATPGLFAVGGDPNGDGTGGWDRLLPPEMSEAIDMQMGLVGALRQGTSTTSHCIFFILLGPNEYMRGKQTFFARVTEGMEVVARLFRVPSTGETNEADAYTFLEPVRIRRITIRK
jgi:cyclophilin family peptidyl-prolyl cis-trans isomerase